jgi:hypothetical protein
VIQIVAFVGALWLPLAANLTGRDGADRDAEHRELATMDEGVFAWFEDHFGFRARMVTWNARVEYFLLGVSPSPSVARGSGGWLFYAESDALADHVSDVLLTAAEIDAWRRTVVQARDWLQRRHAAYVFTIAPDKHVIYPEHLRESVRRAGSRLRMDQVFEAVLDAGVAVDLRPSLVAAKADERVYHLTDSHWNARGAWVAYQDIIAAVRARNRDVPPAWPRSDFAAVEQLFEGLDLARMMGLGRELKELDVALLPRRVRQARVVDPPGSSAAAEVGRLVTEIPGSTLPRAVIFRDSFTTALVPFLSEHFSRAVYLWQKDFVPQQIDAEGADVVIYEIASRNLYNFVPSPDLISE